MFTEITADVREPTPRREDFDSTTDCWNWQLDAFYAYYGGQP
ncbi:hypothetical protein ACW9HQ_52170 [Nocardia gipuzkoensis]